MADHSINKGITNTTKPPGNIAKITVCGPKGRMGQELLKEFTYGSNVTSQTSEISSDSSDSPQLSCKPNPSSSTILILHGLLLRQGTLNPQHNDRATDDPQKAFDGTDVVIDFTPNVAQHCIEAQKQGCAYLCGATDLSVHDQKSLERAATEIPVLWASNFSEGLMIINKLLVIASKMTQSSAWNITISETHHQHKKDKPSGTALTLGQVVGENRGKEIPQDAYACLRGGAVAGRHTVGFHNHVSGEEFFITHEAHHRSLFAKRALYCAEWLYNKKSLSHPGYYSIESVI